MTTNLSFRLLLVGALFLAGVVPAIAMSGEELLEKAQHQFAEIEAWQKRCGSHLTRECESERQGLDFDLLNRMYEISGPITCRVTGVRNFVTQGAPELPEDINCLTKSGQALRINSNNPECSGPFFDARVPFMPSNSMLKPVCQPCDLNACIKERIFVDDVITVETTVASLVFNSAVDSNGNQRTMLVLVLGGEFGKPVSAKIKK